MKSLLRSILGFLDRKFPDKVVVTDADYKVLKDKVERMEKTYSEERLKQIEAEINKFNVQLGFGGTVLPKGMVAPFR